MSGPTWLADIFAALMLAVAVVSFGRLIATRVLKRPTHVDIDLMHLFMGVAMAGMFVSDLNGISEGLWEVVFSVLAVWFMWRCYDFVKRHGLAGRDEDHVHHISHYFTHVVMALAMLNMYFATSSSAGSGAMGSDMGAMGSSAMSMSATGTTADYLFLPLLFFFALSGSAVWELNDIGRYARFVHSKANLAATALVTVGVGGEGATAVGIASIEEDAAPGATTTWLAPRLEAAAHIVMCIAMGYMLVLMF